MITTSTDEGVRRPPRADAARNASSIRDAALNAFRGRGLATPLAQIADAAGVSKASVYNHFDGRLGLIEAVIDELIAGELHVAMAAADAEPDPWLRLVGWVEARRELQYREPAFTDTMMAAYPGVASLAALATSISTFTDGIVRAGLQAGVVRSDLTSGDLFWADVANGLALRELRSPPREDYDRRTRQFIDGLRPRPQPSSSGG